MKHFLPILLVLLCAVWPCWSQTQPVPQAAESALLERYQALKTRGVELGNQRDYKNALTYFEQALSLARQSGDPSIEVKATFNVGLTHSNLGEYKAALDELHRVLEIIEKYALQEQDLQANALVNIASIYGDDTAAAGRGAFQDKKTAIDYAERALPNLQGVRKAHVLAQLGSWRTPNTSEDLTKALRDYYEAATLYRKAADLANFANIQMGIGMLLEDSARLDKARSAYQEALAAARQSKEPRLSFRALRSLARIDDRSSQYQQAIAHYLEALEIATRIGLLEQAQILSDLASVYDALGDYRHRIDYLERVGTIYRELGDAMALAETRRLLGVTYDLSGDYDKVTESFESALQLLPAAGSEEKRAEILVSYASALKRNGDPAKALI